MNLSKFLAGKGLDVSEQPILQGNNVTHFYRNPDNFYSLREIVDYESQDFIFSSNLINKTKFYALLIKEWLNFCKVNGRIIIVMRPNKILNFNMLIKLAKRLIMDCAEIEFSNFNEEKSKGILVIKKLRNILEKGDTIDKWTFGIITNAKGNERVDKEIESIIALKIPNYEIIVCGEYKSKKKFKNLKIIPFDSTIAWITKKKNLICQNAKYENIVVTHDRFEFDSNWYNGMKKYGNYFEVLSCRVYDVFGRRADDWLTGGAKLTPLYRNRGMLEYRDWDINGFICGGLYIIKKKVWKKCPWNNSLIWGQGEDLVISKDFYEKGFVARFNPFSLCITTKERGDMMKGWVRFKFMPNRFITLRDRPLFRRLKILLIIFFRKYILK